MGNAHRASASERCATLRWLFVHDDRSQQPRAATLAGLRLGIGRRSARGRESGESAYRQTCVQEHAAGAERGARGWHPVWRQALLRQCDSNAYSVRPASLRDAALEWSCVARDLWGRSSMSCAAPHWMMPFGCTAPLAGLSSCIFTPDKRKAERFVSTTGSDAWKGPHASRYQHDQL